MKTVAMIPCRLGSERIPFKNLRYMGDELLCEWVIRKVTAITFSEDIYINSESDVFATIAKENFAGFYQRPPELATADAKTDDFVYDFMKGTEMADDDILILINPTSPLVSANELGTGLHAFDEGDYNSMNTVVKHQIHAMRMDLGHPEGVNCDFDRKLQKTQDLNAIYTLAFAFMGWRVGPFKEAYERDGYALFNKPCYFHEVSGKTAINKLSYEEDWEVVERILTGSYGPPRYHEAITRLVK